MSRKPKNNNRRNDDRREREDERKPRNNRSNKPKTEEAVVPAAVGATMNNDPNWYFTNAEVANQAAQLSFQNYLGTPGTVQEYDMPTIMTIHLNPSPGNTYPGASFAQMQRSGFNMSMTKLFNRLSMKSGRNMAYAPQDVGMAVLGVGELLSMVSYIRRMFGVVKWWNVRNRMIPKEIIRAMGIDPEDFFNNFSDYRMKANTLILACNQIPILTNCGYLRKCASLYDNVYKDCDTNLCQYYIHVPATTWILDETSDSRGTMAKTTEVCISRADALPIIRTFQQFLDNVFAPMISALLTSSTLNLVYADIYNLNKTEDMALASIDVISEDYAILPIHDPLVLKQIHNTVALPWVERLAESSNVTHWNDVVCDPDHNCIKYSPTFSIGAANDQGDYSAYPRLIDTDTSDPDLVEKIEITRYACTLGHTSQLIDGVWYNLYVPVPDHWCSGFNVYTSAIDRNHCYHFFSDAYRTEPYDNKALAVWSQFDWAPLLYQYSYRGDASKATIQQIIGDVNSFCEVDDDYIRRLNSIIYMDLFEFR